MTMRCKTVLYHFKKNMQVYCAAVSFIYICFAFCQHFHIGEYYDKVSTKNNFDKS